MTIMRTKPEFAAAPLRRQRTSDTRPGGDGNPLRQRLQVIA